MCVYVCVCARQVLFVRFCLTFHLQKNLIAWEQLTD